MPPPVASGREKPVHTNGSNADDIQGLAVPEGIYPLFSERLHVDDPLRLGGVQHAG